MLLIITTILFTVLIFLIANAIAILLKKFSTKRLNSVDIINVSTGLLTCSFSYAAYTLILRNGEPIIVPKSNHFLNSLELVKVMMIGIPVGGIILLSTIGVCIVPFVVVHEKFSKHYGIPESSIFNVYCSMFLMATSSISFIGLLFLLITEFR